MSGYTLSFEEAVAAGLVEAALLFPEGHDFSAREIALMRAAFEAGLKLANEHNREHRGKHGAVVT